MFLLVKLCCSLVMVSMHVENVQPVLSNNYMCMYYLLLLLPFQHVCVVWSLWFFIWHTNYHLALMLLILFLKVDFDVFPSACILNASPMSSQAPWIQQYSLMSVRYFSTLFLVFHETLLFHSLLDPPFYWVDLERISMRSTWISFKRSNNSSWVLSLFVTNLLLHVQFFHH